MAKFCGKCGSRLDEQTGQCPVCGVAHQNSGEPLRKEPVHPQEKAHKPKKEKKPKEPKRKRKRWPVILVLILVLAIVAVGVGVFFVSQGKLDFPLREDEGTAVERDIPETDTSGFTYYQSNEENIAPIEGSGLFFVNNEVLVLLESQEHKPQLESILSEIGGKIVGELPLVAQYQILLDVPRSAEDMENLCEELKAQEWVTNAFLNYAFELDEQYYPDDKRWVDKWGDIPMGENWGLEAIDAPVAWEHRDEMVSLNVGLIDTMFNTSHEDLSFAEEPFGNSVAMKEVEKGDLEWSSHGNHVAGTFAAGFDNQVGVSGISVKSNLYGVSSWGVCLTAKYTEGDDGSIKEGNYSTSEVYCAGIYYLVAQKNCKVVNISMGLDTSVFNASRECEAAIKELKSVNDDLCIFLERMIDEKYQFVICKAAGNQNAVNNSAFWGNNKYQYFRKDAEDTTYPYDFINYKDYLDYLESGKDPSGYFERYKDKKNDIKKSLISGNVDAKWDMFSGISKPKVASRIIVVGSVGNNGSHKENTIFGFGGTKVHDGYTLAASSQCGSRVDVVAPGVDIYSTTKNGYGKMGGTSMASPHVAGVAAMLFAIDPSISGERVKEIIMESAVGSYGAEGYSMLNANNAVEMLLDELAEEETASQLPEVDNSKIPGEAKEFNGHYYMLCSPNQVTTWEEASAYCQNMGGYLAASTTPEENAFLASLITDGGRRSAYIGLSDTVAEGTFVWSTGENVSYHNWRGTEPNDRDGSEDFAMMYDDGTWNDANFIYEEGRPSEKNVQCYVSATGGSLNLRAEARHTSDLAHEVTEANTLMKFYGEIEQGLGSDGQLHDWYKVYIGAYTSGWARSDLIRMVDQKSVQGNDGVVFICEWGEIESSNENTGNTQPAPSKPSSGTSSPVRDVVLVLDVSGSMSGEPMDETKTASVQFIETVLQENARVGIVTYDSYVERLSDFSTSQTALKQAVESIRAGNSTDIEAGLKEAYSMLSGSQADKKILVLMSDGEPNEGKIGDELVAYADSIKAKGVRIYTLGFFESLSDKAAAQSLLERIATDGCHYEVANAEDLVFFFGDMADQINGQKYIYVRIACPVDVAVTYNGEWLSSAEEDLNQRTSFGTLTFEENEEAGEEGQDDRVKVLRLKEGVDYDLELVGTGRGLMDYTIGFMDEDGEYSDIRTFENVRITDATAIDTVAGVSSTSELNIDEDGDGKYDRKLRAEENGYGEEVAVAGWVYIAIAVAGVLVLLDVVVIIFMKRRKKKKGR